MFCKKYCARLNMHVKKDGNCTCDINMIEHAMFVCCMLFVFLFLASMRTSVHEKTVAKKKHLCHVHNPASALSCDVCFAIVHDAMIHAILIAFSIVAMFRAMTNSLFSVFSRMSNKSISMLHSQKLCL